VKILEYYEWFVEDDAKDAWFCEKQLRGAALANRSRDNNVISYSSWLTLQDCILTFDTSRARKGRSLSLVQH